jgi:hypothetical protein
MNRVFALAAVVLAGLAIVVCQGCDLPVQGEAPQAAVVSTPAAPTPTPSDASGKIVVIVPGESRYFTATNQVVTQPFLDYWQKNGGLQVFGYPISSVTKETDPRTGEVYSAQYFERARFELHSSTGNKVILGRLGAILHPPSPAAKPLKGAYFFKETGHNLSGTFLKFWQVRGGLAVFGYPITEVLTERNPADGKSYQVQYFERARFELHKEYAGTPFEVQLGRLGVELYEKQ